MLDALLDPRADASLQMQAVQAFARIGDPRGAELLSRPEKWTKYTPKIRSAVIATLTARPPMIEELFRAIDRGTIPPTAVPVQRRTELLNHAVPAIRRSAVASFQKLDSGRSHESLPGLS